MSTRDVKKFAERLCQIIASKRLKSREIAEAVGVAESSVTNWKKGKNFPENESDIAKLAAFLGVPIFWLEGRTDEMKAESNVSGPIPISEIRSRMIPVVSWGAAGMRYISYEDFRHFITEQIASASTDKDAFGVIIEGDSMEPRYRAGDRAVIEPNEPLRNHGRVLAKFKDGRQVFKTLEWVESGKSFQLLSINTTYDPIPGTMDDVEFLWPVKEVRTIERV